MTYLEGLNAEQKDAVLATEGPISVLAGAGSGKTRVLTTRIFHLIRQGTPAHKILAVTFTNKASREMRERLAHQLGDGPVPFVATFHTLGRELLQSYGERIGIPKFFTIFDRDDSDRAIREALKALDVDPKEVPPRAILSRISKAKSAGMTAEEFKDKHGRESFRARITAEAWLRYQTTLKKEKALDFDDLITLPVRLLETHEDLRKAAQERYTYIHVDEYQDTNELQGRLVGLLGATHENIFVVGDIDQCLVAGTEVSMADGTKKNIEAVRLGDQVLSNYGSGDLRSAAVTHTGARHFSGELVRLHTEAGRTLTSTPEHIHFAGYRLGRVPQQYFAYLMHKQGVGWRLGVSQTYTNGQRASMIGFQQRCNQEHGDSVWVVGTYDSSTYARSAEYQLSLEYRIPTIPFVARKGSTGGYVHDQKVLDSIFAAFDTDTSAKKLLAEKGLSIDHPHHRAQATRSGRRNIVVTLCGDHRGKTPMHRLALAGSDDTGRHLLTSAGFSVRSARNGSASWRYETAHSNYGILRERVEALRILFPDAVVVENARLGGTKKLPKDGNALALLPAASILPGMAVFDATGTYDVIRAVEQVTAEEETVYDLNIEGTHNFIANGIHTHNCIYTWRGATIDNLLAFEKKYPAARTIVLAQNYRSTKTIVDAANSIIEKNRNRKDKHSTTQNDVGEPIRLHIANSAEHEALWIAREARKRMSRGVPAEQIAVLFRTNFQSRAIEEAFLHEGVPYRLLGTRFLDRKEVKDVLAWVRLALDPSREVDRMRAVQAPTRGIGKVTLGKLTAGKRDDLKAGERTKVAAFEQLVEELHTEALSMKPSAFVRLVIEKSGLEISLLKEGEEGQERLENAKELATLASRYDHTPGEEGIASFLADAALAGDQDELDRKPEATGVNLMTVHASKGLEFNTVFVTGLEEGLFPHEGQGTEERDEEEERRLFYVAVTRAKEQLILTLARVRRIYGTDFFSEPSSFIRDIDEHLIHVEDQQGREDHFIIEA